MQEGSYIGAIGMQCHVGTCLYEAVPEPPPSPQPVVPHKPSHPFTSHPEMATIVCTGIGIVLLAAVTGALIVRDQTGLARLRALDAADGPEDADAAGEFEELRTMTRHGACFAEAPCCCTVQSRPRLLTPSLHLHAWQSRPWQRRSLQPLCGQHKRHALGACSLQQLDRCMQA